MLKKHLIKLSALLAVLAFAGSAFALGAQLGVPTGVTGITPSNNVAVAYQSDAAGTYYAIASKHKQGNKYFGTITGSTSIWFKAGTAGTDLLAADAPFNTNGSNSDSAVASGWTTQ